MHCILYIVDCKTGTLPTSYLLERSLEHGINSLPWKTAQASEFSDGRIKNKWITLNKMFLFVQNKHLFGFLWISETEKWRKMWFGVQPVLGGSLQTVMKTLHHSKAPISFFPSLFKLYYRFHLHKRSLKMKTKGCLKSTNPTEGKENKIPCCSLHFSQNLWSLAHDFWTSGVGGAERPMEGQKGTPHRADTDTPNQKQGPALLVLQGAAGSHGGEDYFISCFPPPALLSQCQLPVVFQQNQTINYIKWQWYDAVSPPRPAGIALLVTPLLQPSAEYLTGRDLSQQGDKVA